MYEKGLVKKILEKPHGYEWSVQGLGMMRLYLSKEVRLHIWDETLRVPDVSDMHTHPWDFLSLVVCGEITNIRYTPSSAVTDCEFRRQEIFCGVGGGLVGEPVNVYLNRSQPEHLGENETYHQVANEIHVSESLRGSITIIERHFGHDEDHAYVYWDAGEWVSAEPREATSEEIEVVTRYSLDRWFNGD